MIQKCSASRKHSLSQTQMSSKPPICLIFFKQCDSGDFINYLITSSNFWFLSRVLAPTLTSKFVEFLEDFDANFGLLNWYKTLSAALTKAQRFNSAVRCGREDVLEYVYIKDGQSNAAMVKAAAENLLQRVHDDLMKASKYPFTGVSLRNVAMRGHADCLRFFLERGYKKDRHVCRIAAEKGHLACLKLARAHGLTWEKSIIDVAALGGHLDCVKFAQDNGCAVSECTAYEAVRGGNVECLQYVLDQGVFRTKRLCNAAATYGHLVCLQQVYAHGCPWDSICTRLAASHGSIECLVYLMGAKCPVDHSAVAAAAANGQERCLRFLLERGCEIRGGKAVHEAAKAGHAACLRVLKDHNAPFCTTSLQKALTHKSDDMYLRRLVEAGYRFPAAVVRTVLGVIDLECLEYIGCSQACDFNIELADAAAEMWQGREYLEILHKYGCPWDKYTSVSAAGLPSAETLKFMHEHGCPWDAQTTERAIECGRIKCLQYALQHGCPCIADACDLAAKSSDMAILKCVHEYGCRLTVNTCVVAARSGNYAGLSYAVSNGAPLDARVCAAAVSPTHFIFTIVVKEKTSDIIEVLQMLKHARSLGCPWDASTTTAAARIGAKGALAYALENRCPCTVDACIAAAEGGHRSCLQLLHEHCCPWDERVSKAAAASGSASCLRYCVEKGCPIEQTTMEIYNNLSAAQRDLELQFNWEDWEE